MIKEAALAYQHNIQIVQVKKQYSSFKWSNVQLYHMFLYSTYIVRFRFLSLYLHFYIYIIAWLIFSFFYEECLYKNQLLCLPMEFDRVCHRKSSLFVPTQSNSLETMRRNYQMTRTSNFHRVKSLKRHSTVYEVLNMNKAE